MFRTSISVGSFKSIRFAVVCRTFCLGVNNSTFLCKIIVLYICCTNLRFEVERCCIWGCCAYTSVADALSA
jgi:hypothetical protein